MRIVRQHARIDVQRLQYLRDPFGGGLVQILSHDPRQRREDTPLELGVVKFQRGGDRLPCGSVIRCPGLEAAYYDAVLIHKLSPDT